MEENKFKTGQEVLVRDEGISTSNWTYALYSHYDPFNIANDDTLYCHIVCGGGEYSKCIPYKGNEDLIGTNNDYTPDTDFEKDLPINTPVMCCTHPRDGWYLKYYAGNNKAYFKKFDSELNAYEYNYIIKVEDFDFDNPENSLKHNIVNKRK